MGNRIFALGDIHGRWQTIRDFWLANKLKENFDENETTLILLGDAGLNYFLGEDAQDRDGKTKEKLGKFPFTYFVIRGNHEERPSICAANHPDKWHTEEFWGNTVYVENEFPYIKYALDEVAFYHIPYVKIPYYLRDDNEETGDIEWEDLMDVYTALVIPGAYSIDKQYRLMNGWSWFEHEQLSSEERAKCLDMIKGKPKVDLVLSHTCPLYFEPTDLFLTFIDQSTVDKSMERLLNRVEYEVDYRAWMWGHFHAFRDYPRTDGRKKLMLYDNYAVDIVDYIEHEEFEKYETYYCRK